MKRIVIILLALLMVFSLSGCIKKIDSKESINLYPAYKMEKKAKLWGYIDDSGKFAIEPKYDAALDFSEEGLAQVHTFNAIGVINVKGEEVLQPRYREIFLHENGYIVAFDGEVNHVFNYQGQEQFSSTEYVYIGPYNDGLFLVATLNNDDGLKIGYVDKLGKIVIEPSYPRAYDFHNGKAVVMVDENLQQIIDKEGKVLKDLEYKLVLPSKGQDTYLVVDKNNLYGYLDKEANPLIEPKFNKADPFQDGRAVVGLGEDSSRLFGVINNKGEYLVEPKYANIIDLGKGYYGIANEEDEAGYKYAILNDKGETITEFIYYSLGGLENKIENDLISVYDGIETYAINLKGVRSSKLPTLEGEGELNFDGKIAKTTLLGRLYYYNAKGKLIWEGSNNYFLREGAQVLEEQYLGDNGLNIFYPVVEGLADKNVEENVNKELYKRFVTDVEDEIIENPNEKYKYYNTSYTLSKINDLLTIQKTSEYYIESEIVKGDIGHIFNISLRNGKFFTIGDLFQEGSNYIKVISDKVSNEMGMKMMQGMDKYKLLDFKEVKEDQSFIPYMEKIEIVFNPSQISSKNETFPRFEITHTDLKSILDMESEFWWTYTNNRGF